jgi:CubicO group peptidase (beta-lactamase class C family)
MLMRIPYLLYGLLLLGGCVDQTHLNGPDEIPKQSFDAKTIANIATAYHEAKIFDGVVTVSSLDQTIYTGSFGQASLEFQQPYRDDTRVRLASVSKPFVAALILRLEEEGRLTLMQTVGDILPALSDSPSAEVTVSQLLSHRSGIPNYQYKKPHQDLQSKVLMSGIGSYPVTVEKMISTFVDEPLNFTPGDRYEYSNSNYVLLQRVIEIASDRSFADAFANYITTPLGLRDTGILDYRSVIPELASGYNVHPEGFEAALQAQFVGVAAPGLIYSNAPDMARWFRALFSNEFFERKETLETMITPRSTAYNDESFIGYGLFRSSLKVGEENVTMIGHDGWGPPFTANLQYIPQKNLIIFAADSVSGFGGATYGETVRLGEDIVRAAFGEDIDLPTVPADLELSSLIDQLGIENALAKFKASKMDVPFGPRLESELNSLGYAYLGYGNTDGAVSIFELNTELFPQSSNAYDSLGEANQSAGRLTEARDAYGKALMLKPDSERLKGIVDDLEE